MSNESTVFRSRDQSLSGQSRAGNYLLEGGEHTSTLDDVNGADRAPGDGGGVTLGEDGDGATIDHELPVSGGDLTLVLSMGRVIPDIMPRVTICYDRISLAQKFI